MGKPASGIVIENKYRLERELGAGGMGSVWLATQLMVDRPVAVKLLHPDFVDEAELQARFEVEAKAIGKLNHPNVITLYDFGWSDDLTAFYTVIEYIDGVSLDKRLNDRMPLAEVANIIRQIALALDHAHHHGILHRDLKPENVMLARMTDGSEIAKVLDFGIARIVKGTYDRESPESQRITKAGEVFGTPAYMSPEQARSIRRLTPSADLYSLGVMMYELVAGQLPFFAKSAFDLLMLHVTKPVPAIQRHDVPPEMLDIIFRLLDKDPEKRFQTGGELARALNKLRLPEVDAYVEDDAFEGYPTFVDSNVPTFERQALSLTNQETNPDGPPVALPTPAMVPYSHEIRANTVLLHGGVKSPPQATTTTGAQIRSTQLSPPWLALLLVAFVAFLSVPVVWFALSPSKPDKAEKPPAYPKQLLVAPESPDPMPEPEPVVVEEPQIETADAGVEEDASPDVDMAKPEEAAEAPATKSEKETKTERTRQRKPGTVLKKLRKLKTAKEEQDSKGMRFHTD